MTLSVSAHTSAQPPSTAAVTSLTVTPSGFGVGDMIIICFMAGTSETGLTAAAITPPDTSWVIGGATANPLYSNVVYAKKTATAADLAAGSFTFGFASSLDVTAGCLCIHSSIAGNKIVTTTSDFNSSIGNTHSVVSGIVATFTGRGSTAPAGTASDGTHTFTNQFTQTLGSDVLSIIQRADTYVVASTTTMGAGIPSGGGATGLVSIYMGEAAGNPLAPTMQAPSPSSHVDTSQPYSFVGTYRSTNGQAMDAVSIQVVVNGAVTVQWNGTGWTVSGTRIWVSQSCAVGATFTVTDPGGTFAPGDTLVATVACQEAGASLQSPTSSLTFFTAASPNVTITAPAASSTLIIPQPVVTWSYSGTAQATYRVLAYTAAQVAAGGFTPGVGPNAWDSGTIPATATSVTVGVPLPSGGYTIYVVTVDTNGLTNGWADSVAFTVAIQYPNAPTWVSVVPATDPTSHLPEFALSLLAGLNQLSQADAGFNGSNGGWTATNATLSQQTANTLEGTDSMGVTPTSSPVAVSVESPHVPCPANGAGVPIYALASLYGLAFGGNASVAIKWYHGATPLSTSGATTAALSGTWIPFVVSAFPPATADHCSIVITFTSTGTSLAFDVDEAGIFPVASAPAWCAGGFGLGTADTLEIQSSTDQVTWTDIATPLVTQASPTVVAVTDSTDPPGVGTYFRARTVSQKAGAGAYYYSAWSTTFGPVTSNSQDLWWIQMPGASPAAALGFALSGDPGLGPHEQGTITYPLGRDFPVKTTDGFKGRTGSIPIETTSDAQLDALMALITQTGVLLLWTPNGDALYVTHDPNTDIGVQPVHSTMTADQQWTSVTYPYKEVGAPS